MFFVLSRSHKDMNCAFFLFDLQGSTVAAMGSFKGLKQIRRIVEDCMQNKMHPLHHIKVIYDGSYSCCLCFN